MPTIFASWCACLPGSRTPSQDGAPPRQQGQRTRGGHDQRWRDLQLLVERDQRRLRRSGWISARPGRATRPGLNGAPTTLKHLLDFRSAAQILKHLLHQVPLDRIFHALADPTRRAIVERLAGGPASVSALAAPFAVSLSAIGQHVGLLEASGLVRTIKRGRTRTVELAPEALGRGEQWFTCHRARWERRLDRLGALLAEPDDGDRDATPVAPRPRKSPKPTTPARKR
jgi:DNA-binding transcriptional ArsR family regulator